MNNVDPEYRTIIEALRSGGHYSGEPPLPPGVESGKSEPMKADWEPRVSRLELGFCAGIVLIFGAIISSYLMLAGKIDETGDKVGNAALISTDLRGDVKLLNERTVSMDKKLDRIEAKLDQK